jgi:hypothetical protein
MRRLPNRWLFIAAPVASVTLAVCDPVVNVAGANSPAWLLSAIAGALLAFIFRTIFSVIGIEREISPCLLIYAASAFLLGCATYLLFFDRLS